MITIHSNGDISIKGQRVGSVKQMSDGTHAFADNLKLDLPTQRYALSCDYPASGVPGRAQFEADFLRAIGR